MVAYPRSLKQKMILGYFIGLALMIGVVLVNWENLDSVEETVLAGEKVSDLFDTTLEIRRYEKNYFLFGEQEDYKELLNFVNKAENLLNEISRENNIFAGLLVVPGLKADIKEYKYLLKTAIRTQGEGNRKALEKKIRQKGKSIVEAAEEMSRAERKIIQDTLRSSRDILLISVLFLVACGFIAGAVFYRMFIKPLGILERHMKRIADGEFSLIPVKYGDRELVSLGRAFNRMLIELEARQRHIIQSEKLASLGTLLFGVAHEINNPLSNISTSCQILKEEIIEPDIGYKKELLSQIESETDRAKDIVSSILDFSRGDEKTVINLKKTVDEAIRLIRTETPAKIEIHREVPEDITLSADKQRLQQVFLNLIKNSIEAITDEGKISISVRTNARDKTVDIKVTDNGIGMDRKMLSRIFDPLFSARKTKKGYGLGLFIVHNIVTDHGGTISVDSTLGRGTTFLIKLPQRSFTDAK